MLKPFPAIRPMPLVRLPEAFSDPDWIFELKLDGFRAIAYIERGACTLVSRNGHAFRRFHGLGRHLGDILVCLDAGGRSMFNRLMFSRAEPVFSGFDLLWMNGRDLRDVPLIERKHRLAQVVGPRSSCLLVVQHVERCGIDLFAAACDHDLEGIVGKWAQGRYETDGTATSWVKIKNPAAAVGVTRAESDSANGLSAGQPV